MALVSEVLAQAGVSILALSAFERDHIFVPGGPVSDRLECPANRQAHILFDHGATFNRVSTDDHDLILQNNDNLRAPR